tara:strand:- start:68 stop:328 length:261 start_codon:yes stop_codon:yes gene_type:complete
VELIQLEVLAVQVVRISTFFLPSLLMQVCLEVKVAEVAELAKVLLQVEQPLVVFLLSNLVKVMAQEEQEVRVLQVVMTTNLVVLEA